MPNKSQYSNIKDLYIEVNEYDYFHSSYSIDKDDKRFVGRKKIIERIKSILYNGKTKAGTYLITGYRGTGKTSLLNKVLSEITAPTIQFYIGKYGLLFLFSFLFWGFLLIKQNNQLYFNWYFIIIPPVTWLFLPFLAWYYNFKLKCIFYTFGKRKDNNSKFFGTYFSPVL